MNSDIASKALPQFFPRQWLGDAPSIAHMPFPSRICIGYVVRVAGGYSYLMRNELVASGLDIAQLHELALENLAALEMPDLNVATPAGGPEAFLSDSVDNFTAIRILLPAVREALARHLGAEYFAAIPCRDWFMCWSKNHSTEQRAKNASDVRDMFSKDDHNLTPDILWVSDRGFSLHSEQNGMTPNNRIERTRER